MQNLLTLDEWQAAAKAKLSQNTYDYYAGGALEERALSEGGTAYDAHRIYHRVLVDVSKIDSTVSILGETLSMPIIIAPSAMHQMADPQGELATARAAARMGTHMIQSTLSNFSLEEVAQAAPGRTWFQLYVYKDRAVTKEIVGRAQAAGFRALVVTVDAPVLGRRLRDERNQFKMPEGLSLGNFKPQQSEQRNLPPTQGSGLSAYVSNQTDPALTWNDIAWLRSITDMPIFLKGIVRAGDAKRAVQEGVAGIVVSNHGGRQLDCSPAPIQALPAVVEAVNGACDVLIDGGIRRGTDVIKALALGAKAVLIGRPILWGLAVGGEDGVVEVLEHFRKSLHHAMILSGCPTIADITPDLLRP